MKLLSGLKNRLVALKREVAALSFAVIHPGTPPAAKVVAFVVVAFALSPIDLIPDFIPVLGVLDDLILIPLGVLIIRRMIPPHVLEECRVKASDGSTNGGIFGRAGVFVVAGIWVFAVVCGAVIFVRMSSR